MCWHLDYLTWLSLTFLMLRKNYLAINPLNEIQSEKDSTYWKRIHTN